MANEHVIKFTFADEGGSAGGGSPSALASPSGRKSPTTEAREQARAAENARDHVETVTGGKQRIDGSGRPSQSSPAVNAAAASIIGTERPSPTSRAEAGRSTPVIPSSIQRRPDGSPLVPSAVANAAIIGATNALDATRRADSVRVATAAAKPSGKLPITVPAGVVPATVAAMQASRAATANALPPSKPPIVRPPATRPPKVDPLERIRDQQRQRIVDRVGGRASAASRSKGPGGFSQIANAAGLGALARFAGPLAAVGIPALAAKFAINRVSRRTDDLAKLSPEIAVQRAINERLRVEQNLRAASQQGGKLAEIERLKGAASRATTGFLDRQQIRILDAINRITGGRGVDSTVSSAVDALGGEKKVESIIDAINKTPGSDFIPFLNQVRLSLEALIESNKALKDSRDVKIKSPIKQLLDELKHIDDPPPGANPNNQAGKIKPFAAPVLDFQLP